MTHQDYLPADLTRLPLLFRLQATLLAGGCAAVLAVAMAITPSPNGVGGHTQLELQPCQFLGRTGLPAPTCGMTTSFAWFVRGNILASVYVQPMGTVLAAGAAASTAVGAYMALTGRPVHRRFVARFNMRLAVLAIGFASSPGVGRSSSTCTAWTVGANDR